MKRRIHINIFTVAVSVLCLLNFAGNAQKNVSANTAYSLIVHYKDSGIKPLPVIKNNFTGLQAVYDYINSLPRMLAAKGYAVASVDSAWQVGNAIHINLYFGTKYTLVQLRTSGIDKIILDKSGYTEKNFLNKPLNFAEIEMIREKLLSVYENEGYPFATVFLDSTVINDDKISAILRADKGTVYRIDSIKNYGKLQLNPKFLQRYLGIKDGSTYNRDKLKDVDRKMLELPYAQVIQPSGLTMLGSGAILNVYADNKKSSEASAILGFLPNANNTGKLQLTGDVNLDLKNIFNSGEGLVFKYQALQPKSPRLKLGYDKPFIFRSAYGAGFLFDLFKKDSAFLQVNAQLSVSLNLTAKQTGKVLLQWQNTALLQGGIDTVAIKMRRELPVNIDVKSVNAGISYEFRNTNYIYNPVRGNDLNITALAGIKNISKNNDILALKSSGFNYSALYDSLRLRSYQLRVKFSAAHYSPISKSSTFKTAVSGGIYASPDIFRNEVFQIGGYRLLRGFDEESIYATQYAVLTGEYRALLSLNSYLFGFIDAGITKTIYRLTDTKNYFTGAGLGILYETKAGLLNLSLALGKRDDVPFNIRQAAKIHFGYINYF